MKLYGEGLKPKEFGTPGIEKSSISSLSKIPVSESIILDPQIKLTFQIKRY